MSAPAGAWAAGVIFGFFWALLGDTCGQGADEVEFGHAPSVASSASSSSSGETTSTAQGGAGGEGGSGGAGGSTTTATTGGGEGGQGGAPPECAQASDCGQDGACDSWVCHLGACLHAFSPPGSDAGDAGPAGDCLRIVCDGAGGTMPEPNTNDLPDDSNDCTIDTCDLGPTFAAKPLGTSCSTSGGHLCQDGACVPFIPVKCKVNVDGQVYTGCDGMDHWAQYQSIDPEGSNNTCQPDGMDVVYCAPGTKCAVWKAGQLQMGKCQ